MAKLTKSNIFQTVVATVLAGYMALIKRTTRWTVLGRENVEPIWDSGQGFVGCVFHGRFLMSNSGWSKKYQHPAILISQSNDGDFISRTAKALGLSVIRGSSKRSDSDKERGGSTALRGMIRHIENGGVVVITPDGPRGPRMRVGPGPVRLAKMTGTQILPYALSVSNRKVFGSWDRFMFPFPFGRGAIVYGEPVTLSDDPDREEQAKAREILEERLIAANQLADKTVGKEIIQPAEPRRQRRISAEHAKEVS